MALARTVTRRHLRRPLWAEHDTHVRYFCLYRFLEGISVFSRSHYRDLCSFYCLGLDELH